MRLLYALFLFIVVSLQNLYASDKPVKGALCLIRADQQLLLVKEVITNKLSLPGGTIEKNEAPELAAQRETWEETGIKVRADRLLGMTDSAYIYNCATEDRLIAYQYQHSNHYRTIPVWDFPHYGVEVRRVFLAPPEFVYSEQYRYPEQWNGIVRDFYSATDQQVSYISAMTETAPLIQKKELQFINLLHSALPEGVKTSALQLAKLIDAIPGAVLLSLLFVAVLALFGLSFSLRLLLTSSVSVWMLILSRSYLRIPRPFEYMPSVRLGNSFGFSVPDTVIVIATVVVLLLIKTDTGQGLVRRWIYKVLLLTAITAYGLIQFYLGNQFISGMLISLLLAWLLVTIFQFTEGQGGLTDKQIKSPLLWFFIALVSAGFTYYSYSAEVASVCLSGITLALLLTTKNKTFRVSVSGKRNFAAVALILVIHILLSSVAQLVSYSSVYSSLTQLSYTPLLICLLWFTFIRRA